jgi:hypothetical protein
MTVYIINRQKYYTYTSSVSKGSMGEEVQVGDGTECNMSEREEWLCALDYFLSFGGLKFTSFSSLEISLQWLVV